VECGVLIESGPDPALVAEADGENRGGVVLGGRALEVGIGGWKVAQGMAAIGIRKACVVLGLGVAVSGEKAAGRKCDLVDGLPVDDTAAICLEALVAYQVALRSGECVPFKPSRDVSRLRNAARKIESKEVLPGGVTCDRLLSVIFDRRGKVCRNRLNFIGGNNFAGGDISIVIDTSDRSHEFVRIYGSIIFSFAGN
jgi:hypothetical protein